MSLFIKGLSCVPPGKRMITYGDVLRKVVHFLLIVSLAAPLYWRELAESIFPPPYSPIMEVLVDPGSVYAMIVIGAALINAFRIKSPIAEEKLVEFRRKITEMSPFGKKIEEIMEIMDSFVNAMQRDYERRAGYLGLVYGTVGVFIAYTLFGYEVIYGIAALATTDIFSSLGGMTFGKRKLPFSNGTLEGTIIGFFSFLFPLLFVEPVNRAIILAAAASFVEAYGVEDNLSVPVFVSFISWIMRNM